MFDAYSGEDEVGATRAMTRRIQIGTTDQAATPPLLDEGGVGDAARFTYDYLLQGQTASARCGSSL